MTFFIFCMVYIIGFLLTHYVLVPYFNSVPGRQFDKKESFDMASIWPIVYIIIFLSIIVFCAVFPFKYMKEQFTKKNGKDLWETMNDKFNGEGK